MAHREQIEWIEYVCRTHMEHFEFVKVLDIGSLDINGSNRGCFSDSIYIGCDLLQGPNVDILGPVHKLPFVDEWFDTVISTEAFEHDLFLPDTLRKVLKLLRPGGLFVFTCATTGRGEHGTASNHPEDSPLTVAFSDVWKNYYCNVTEDMIRKMININHHFSKYEFNVNHEHHDLRFWGIRNDKV